MRYDMGIKLQVLQRSNAVSETGYYRFLKNFGKPGKDAVFSVSVKPQHIDVLAEK